MSKPPKPVWIKKTDIKATDGTYKHLYICHCGAEFLAVKRKVDCGIKVSCGCSKMVFTPGNVYGTRFEDPTQSAFNKIYGNYRREARKASRAFELNKPVFMKIVTSLCHYCGNPPDCKMNIRPQNPHCFYYNGIDRKDNGVGYVESNSLPCCRRCNFLKGQLSYDEFINQLISIVNYLGVV